MATDTEIFTKHNLISVEPKMLMRELSERFNCNVYLIFRSHVNLDDYAQNIKQLPIENPNDVNAYLLDKHIISEELPNETLSIDDYMYDFLYETFGEEAGNLPEFSQHWYPKDSSKNLEIIKNFMEDTKIFDFSGAFLPQAVTQSNVQFYSWDFYTRWWSMQELFFDEGLNHLLDYFLLERQKLIETVKIFGGTELYYHSEHDPHAKLGQGNKWDMSHEEIDKALSSKAAKTHTINFRKLFTNPTYYSKLRQIYLEDYRFYTIIFDDMKPLKKSDISVDLYKR